MFTSEEGAVEMLEELGAYQIGHFVLASGRHAQGYVDAWAAYADPGSSHRLTTGLLSLALENEDESKPIDVFMGPERAAIWLCKEMSILARRNYGRKVLSMFAEKDKSRPDEKYAFVIPRRWAGMLKGKRVAIIEDVSTTGGSFAEVARLVAECQATVVMVVIIWNRGKVTAEQTGVPAIFALVNQTIDSSEADKCPDCHS